MVKLQRKHDDIRIAYEHGVPCSDRVAHLLDIATQLKAAAILCNAAALADGFSRLSPEELELLRETARDVRSEIDSLLKINIYQ